MSEYEYSDRMKDRMDPKFDECVTSTQSVEEFEKEKAEMRERMKERNYRAQQKNGRRTSSRKAFGKTQDRLKQLETATTRFLHTLVRDCEAFDTMSGDRTDGKFNLDRKKLMGLIREEIQVIRTLEDIKNIIRDKKAKDESIKIAEGGENVSSIEEARKALKKYGLEKLADQ